jgi:hypothetical protein
MYCTERTVPTATERTAQNVPYLQLQNVLHRTYRTYNYITYRTYSYLTTYKWSYTHFTKDIHFTLFQITSLPYTSFPIFHVPPKYGGPSTQFKTPHFSSHTKICYLVGKVACACTRGRSFPQFDCPANICDICFFRFAVISNSWQFLLRYHGPFNLSNVDIGAGIFSGIMSLC